MKTTIQNKLNSAKNHVVNHRGRYAFVAGLLAGSYVTAVAVQTAGVLEDLSDDLMESIETPS